MKNNKKFGEVKSFKKSWKEREETYYTHWTTDVPKNQIQYAFRKHWEVFNLLLVNKLFNKGNRCLEVGCGRGTISAYFSDAGYKTTLLDISPDVIDAANKIFKKNKLEADFKVGDANSLPYPEASFDVVFSLGLLEHFEQPVTTIKEQVRVLSEGGIFIGYIVPKYTDNVQKEYEWINQILKAYKQESGGFTPKEKLFRSDVGSEFYMKVLQQCGLRGIQSSGIYPVPMISHSIEFPFTLMPEAAELGIINYFENLLKKNTTKNDIHPWLCKEGHGQALLVWGYK